MMRVSPGLRFCLLLSLASGTARGGAEPKVKKARAALTPAGRGSLPGLPSVDGGSHALCSGDYADEFSALSSRVREFERDPANQYSYCLRTSAVYDCLSYATDGAIRHDRKTVVAHGTGFAYKKQGGETFVLTNDHVATWPAVSDEEHPGDGVPAGCKLVSESVKVVDDEGDDYEGNDVGLTRVVVDPSLDVAVLKTRATLKIIPYRVGRSAALHVGNAVMVHGFPLGAFAATNLGKVVNAYDHDTERDWDHVDFVVDALLSPGNSGSPVLALSCKTGEYELVGIYHAGYTRGSALNVVVGIDQIKDLMTTLRRAPRVAEPGRGTLGPDDRRAVVESLKGPGATPFFPLGNLVAAGRVLPTGALVFEVLSRGFPLHDERLLVVEDLPSSTGMGFGDSGRVFVGNSRGLRAWERSALDAEAQAQIDLIVARLRAGAAGAAQFRSEDATTSKGHKRRRQIERQLARQAELDGEATHALLDLSERLGPKTGEKTLALRDVLPAIEREEEAAEVKSAPPPVAEKAEQKAQNKPARP